MEYKVRCRSKVLKVNFDKSDEGQSEKSVKIGKTQYDLKVCSVGQNNEIKLLSVNNKIYSVQVRRREDGLPSKIILNGKAFPVEIERVESTRFRGAQKRKRSDGVVVAILPGLIREVFVSPGDEVKRGQPVVILEAMKMENEISAPCDGIVAKVSVKTNKIVGKGDTLIEVKPR